MTNKIIVGYTTGIFDLFHIGHLNILRNAKSLCDYLIVGVTEDKLTESIKGKLPIIPLNERLQIVEAIRFVDKAIPKVSLDNIAVWENYKYDIFIKGDDWKGSKMGIALETELSQVGVVVKYLPYTKNTSSTILREAISKLR